MSYDRDNDMMHGRPTLGINDSPEGSLNDSLIEEE